MRRIQFGAGSLNIEGWENHDMDVDVTRPLPYATGSVDFVFSDMMLEHVTPQQAWLYLDEVFRILRPGGKVRTVIPDFLKCFRERNPEWLKVNQGVTNNNGTIKDQMKSILFCHGHQGLWCSELLMAVKQAIGFVHVRLGVYGESGLEQHWRSVGREVAKAESGIVEGTKP